LASRFLVIVPRFEAINRAFDGGTELTMIHEHLPDEEARKSH
jgi:hypothetical protein